MGESTDEVWGNLRSALQSPGASSWQRVTQILASEHPEHEHLCAYAGARLRTWPRHIARPVPDDALRAALRGAALPPWIARTCNALHIVKARRSEGVSGAGFQARILGVGHLPGLLDPGWLARLCGAFEGVDLASVVIEELEWEQDAFDAFITLLSAQRDIAALSLAYTNIGRDAFRRIEDTGALGKLTRLCLDGNHIGWRGTKRLLSTHTRWSARPVREFSWRARRLGHGALDRLVHTPWFGDLEVLDLRDTRLCAEGLHAWCRALNEPNLRELSVDLDLVDPMVDDFLHTPSLRGLESLQLRDLAPRAYRPMRGEQFAAIFVSSVWRDTITRLSVHTTRMVDSFEAFRHCELPVGLRHIDLQVYDQARDLEPVLITMYRRDPDRVIRLNGRILRMDEQGELAWWRDGLEHLGKRWWRDVDDGSGWR